MSDVNKFNKLIKKKSKINDNFIVTVTNNIEGCPIGKYLDSICSNVVIGTNVFSDIAASFSNFFGGYSGSYKSNKDSEYCETCGRNIKGLHKDEIIAIEQFKEKVEILKDFL